MILSEIPLFNGATEKDFFIKRFGGLTNLNYGIIFKEKKYVLRVPNHSLNLIDRQKEKINLEEAAAHNFITKFLYFNAATGVQLRPYIEGTELCAGDITFSTIDQVADIFHKLHLGQLKFQYVDNFKLIENYRKELEKKEVSFSRDYDGIFPVIMRIERVLLKTSGILAPIHGDPHPVNFLNLLKVYLC